MLGVRYQVSYSPANSKSHRPATPSQLSCVRFHLSHVKLQFYMSGTMWDPLSVRKSNIKIHHRPLIRCHVSLVWCEVSHYRCSASCVRCHLSRIRCHVSDVRCHVSQVNFQKYTHKATNHLLIRYYLLIVRCHVWHVKCQVSNVRCQISDLTCLVSDVRCQGSCVPSNISENTTSRASTAP